MEKGFGKFSKTAEALYIAYTINYTAYTIKSKLKYTTHSINYVVDNIFNCVRKLGMISDVIKLRLKEVLKEKDKTLLAVSQETGISYTTLHNIKKNKVKGITFDVLEKLCKNLDCQPNDLIELQP